MIDYNKVIDICPFHSSNEILKYVKIGTYCRVCDIDFLYTPPNLIILFYIKDNVIIATKKNVLLRLSNKEHILYNEQISDPMFLKSIIDKYLILL